MIASVAAQCGIDPSPFTLRQLVKARDDKQQMEWWHTANVVWAIASGLLPKKHGAWQVKDFHPMQPKQQRQAMKADELAGFKRAFKKVTTVKASEVRVKDG